MICWHEWTKWEQYTERGKIQRYPFSNEMIPYTQIKQRRYCKKCGKIQVTEVEK